MLRDPEKRKIYDQYGEEAVKEGMGGGGGGMPGDIFGDLFGMGGMGSRSRGPQRSDDINHRIKVSLEDLYKGSTRKLKMGRNIKCPTCTGTGSKSGARHTCSVCNGTGIEVRMHRLGPGLMQQVRETCSNCAGAGTSVPPTDKCPACKGKGLISDTKVFEVHVEPGMKHGSKIVMRGEAGIDKPGVEPGDVNFILDMREHETFKRLGCDLLLERHVGLVEALTGTQFHLKHLDGRILEISSNGNIIKPDAWMSIKGEGMPVQGRPFDKGNLYIHFTVDFPDKITDEQAAALRATFGSSANGVPNGNGVTPMNEDDVEEVSMTPVEDMEAEVKMRRQFEKSMHSSAYDSDSDDDMPRGAQRVACAQQ